MLPLSLVLRAGQLEAHGRCADFPERRCFTVFRDHRSGHTLTETPARARLGDLRKALVEPAHTPATGWRS